MRYSRIIIRVVYVVFYANLIFSVNVLQSQQASTFVSTWSNTGNIGLTNGSTVEIYDTNFELLQSVELPMLDPSFPIFQMGYGLSPNLEYAVRTIIFSDSVFENEDFPYASNLILQVWRVSNQELVFEVENLSFLSGVIWNDQGTLLAAARPTGQGGQNLLIFDLTGNVVSDLVPPVTGVIDRITWNNSGNLIAFNTGRDLHIWDRNSNQYLTPPTSKYASGGRLQFDPQSDRLAYRRSSVETNDTEILIWDTSTSQQVGQITRPGQEGIRTFAWGRNNIVFIGSDSVITVWDSITLQQIASYSRGFIRSVKFSPDGNLMLTNGPDASTFQTVDVLTGNVISTNYGALLNCDNNVSNATTLINALSNATSGTTICLADGTYTLTSSQVTDHGTNGLPLITSDITLIGLGDNVDITLVGAGAPAFRLFHVKDTGALKLVNVTLSD